MSDKYTLLLLKLQTVSGNLKHPRVVFCIDASERDNNVKAVIYQHIVAYFH